MTVGTRPETRRADQLREARHPVYVDRTLRLGTFSTNLSGGCAISTIDGVLEADWGQTTALAAMGDAMEFEALVPVGRWRGFGGPTNFNGAGFECFTWAAGIASATERAGLFVTSHVPTIHPVMAAKQAATIDHISGGRLALNVVTGWHAPEIEMFGAELLPHDERYAVGQEWVDIIVRLWTAEEPFSYDGKYFRVTEASIAPRPLQAPHPVLMNAGSSGAGRHFGARNCDVLFASSDLAQQSPEAMRVKVDDLKRLAREEYGREVQVWTNAYVVQEDTEAEARQFLDYYVNQRGDWEAVDNLVTGMGINSQSFAPETLEAMKFHFIAGWAGYPIVGTKEQITDTLVELSTTGGLDGIVLSWPRYLQDMARFQEETHPLLVQAGVR
ncbi:alkanesulfonate monooxygenase SsuD/methylene tetrahydromethanopterin reductase-like flavin-dependent oxidoreductase (luciferase family) [Actinomycetospora succinea]|uniref:Alkanesulfonate monooxygenase SsuD/methylene tetrahydromethanopterin reductase-like flavin-dependent oxidoreductase (Luciferase family) n=1 Tax=Actinomycetospora succinea TaxID=663603 RepID=A0A4R6UJ47_9PSEU|nr:LLM class flavin-dependent oxidoreductase [Actinomycetospora succinea]TDQ46950.1 alkanesulfonate monooxygenase SsuD/methylene tetrahydromethanopterin reductase-like flavin-dependent oxidoreductase (luciferase family) [Actinomycetospora succinea]